MVKDLNPVMLRWELPMPSGGTFRAEFVGRVFDADVKFLEKVNPLILEAISSCSKGEKCVATNEGNAS